MNGHEEHQKKRQFLRNVAGKLLYARIFYRLFNGIDERAAYKKEIYRRLARLRVIDV